ncbi:MAG: ATP-dependent sacrificial sulfur transferase LarE [Planctomycetaceae bacterium]
MVAHDPPEARLPLELDTKRRSLLQLLSGFDQVVVAFSGGVDSTVVAKAAYFACGESAWALTADSASLAASERSQAEHIARLIGIRHEFIKTDEFDREEYRRNAADRCYYCKQTLYQTLATVRSELRGSQWVNGANVDDLGDHRPGMDAAREFNVRSPLIEVGLNKDQVRELARFWQLPVWNKPAAPCLASRIAYGIEVTPERVARVEAAESLVRQELGIRGLRVRLEANDLARIEVPVSSLPDLLRESVRINVIAELKRLGFRYVTLDLEGLRTGSLNAVLPVDALQILS